MSEHGSLLTMGTQHLNTEMLLATYRIAAFLINQKESRLATVMNPKSFVFNFWGSLHDSQI